MSDIPTFDVMYAAISGRDTRFDGTFSTAVHTTGVYCKPSCPARKPHPHNVTFYPSAAAAQLAGYRACRRCVPEALPGSPWWNIPGSVAARAVQLIEQGVVDDEGVTGLAARLGWSPRTVTRVLVEQTGATPLAHARARRAWVAHALITGTDQRFADIAFAAGFSSVRQFNDTVLAVYGATPTRLRAAAGPRRDGGAGAPGSLRAQLTYRPPLNWDALLTWYAARALPGFDEVVLGPQGSYRLAVRLPHGAATLALRNDHIRGRLVADLALSDLRDYGPGCDLIRRLVDLDADPTAIDEHLGTDVRLRPLVATRPGMRLPGTATPLEALLRALTGQQVQVAAGRGQLARLVAAAHAGSGAAAAPAVGRPTNGAEDGVRLRPFPSAEAFLASGLSDFRGPAARRDALLGALTLAHDSGLGRGRSWDDVAADLARIPGIGPWTIAYTLMRGYGHPDVDLATDRALINAARRLADLPAGRLLAAASPWRSYAALHLWLGASDDAPSQAAR